MIEETIDARYTLVQSILEKQLEAWFGTGNFKIIVRLRKQVRWSFIYSFALGAARRLC
jgi:hypothetical protein